MDEHLRRAARAAIGFMPESEGLALHDAGRRAGRLGPLLEIGSYCGQSAIYLGAAARASGTVLFSVDH
ncbi:MAG TPA: class I SAM-dependent methyltransferase, partial [Candidatus Dormibacteraeota bacterium]